MAEIHLFEKEPLQVSISKSAMFQLKLVSVSLVFYFIFILFIFFFFQFSFLNGCSLRQNVPLRYFSDSLVNHGVTFTEKL